MKILFVDHAFHAKTRSSDFFHDIVARSFSVDRVFLDPTDTEAMAALTDGHQHDLVILWQMDFLAPIFLGRGMRTVVVPMYDGSSLMPDLHWLWASQASFINFSRRLHERILRLGGSSLLVKYFLPPVAEPDRARFEDGLRVLLWQRRPEHGIHLNLIERLFGDQLKSVHIHDAPDDPTLDTASYTARGKAGYELTVSKWFPTRAGFESLLAAHNTILCPRLSEGIGMVMLEGLARGMLVVANDAPTHDEYISNWINGVLIDPVRSQQANFQTAAAMGAMAWKTAELGYEQWRAKEAEVATFLDSVPEPVMPAEIDVAAFAGPLVRSYVKGCEDYKTWLQAHVTLIGQMSRYKLHGKLDDAGVFHPEGVAVAGGGPKTGGQDLHWLSQNRFSVADLCSGPYRLVGTVRQVDETAWVEGQSLVLGFRFDPHLGVTERLRISYRLPTSLLDRMSYCIALNDHTLKIGALEADSGWLECDVPPHAAKVNNVLHLQLGEVCFAFAGSQPVSLGIQHIEFVP